VTDRFNTLTSELRKAVEVFQRVDVSPSRSPDQDIIYVRAYFVSDGGSDFQCTWALDGSRWSEPVVVPALNGSSFADVDREVAVPGEATVLFDAVAKRIGGIGRLNPSELALLNVLTDSEFDLNEIAGENIRAALDVLHRELAFRTPERLVETTHDSKRAKEYRDYRAAGAFR
jgi:hypothetical protein